MKTSVSKVALLVTVLAASTIALTPAAMADRGRAERMYRVTITNATLGQPVAPSMIATHTDEFRLFELGPAPAVGDAGYDYYFALATMAETGVPSLLRDQVAASAGVWEAEALPTNRTPPVLLPGESNSITIGASRDARYLSAAAMLGATNDAFYAVRGAPLPRGIGDSIHIQANAYDAGSEANAESATTIGALGATDDNPMTGVGINTNGEGYIHIHAGIHGIGGSGGLDASTYDWRNPVVEVTIERIQ
ncbi:MAG: spondin domain-containing protein [Gammaproteobacteria bacterium]|nr:spondin domain-containing protein [Gammaproteobacteria bacterium]MCP5196030.1 spondin domain-containing protein [Gammaproteobacteria bacterium]